MSAKRIGLTATTILGLLLTLAVLNGTAGAQTYPPPVGSLTTQSSSTVPSAGTTTTLTATVLNSSGAPVPGSSVVFQISSQPGTDARFSNGLTEITATTDATGTATAVLSVGRTPGGIIVKTISGDKTSQLTLQVQSAVGVPATGGQPPSEGNGGITAWQAAIIAAGIVILLSGGVIAARRRRT